MSDQPLFQQTDEQEQAYAPQQLPDNPRVEADERVPMMPDDTDDRPVAVGISTGGAGAAPVSDSFDPGERRERRDLVEGQQDIVGRDPRDERTR